MNGEVNLVVAHPLEAEALLAWFDLAEIEPRGELRRYSNNKGLALVITGMGAEKAAAGVKYLHGCQAQGFRAWLNIGIAGHQRAEIGSGFLINRIRRRQSGELYWPPVTGIDLPGCGLVTVAEAETEYPEDAAYDMEAAGFFAAASGLVTTDLIQVFKIISDNRENSTANVNASLVRELFQRQESAIRKLVSHLRERCARFADYYGMPEEYELLLRKYHFSATRKAALARTCRRFRALDRQDRLSALARTSFPDAQAVMAALAAELTLSAALGKSAH